MGAHRFLALSQMISSQWQGFSTTFKIPCLVGKPETPSEGIRSIALVSNAANEAHAKMTWVDEILAALRVATSLGGGEAWELMSADQLLKEHQASQGSQPFCVTKL